MTWVIGASTVLGYGIMLSDVCITFTLPDGTTRPKDCLRKIFPVCHGLAAGFAGSVNLGFAMLRDLYLFTKANPKIEKTPEWITENWCSRARLLFNNAVLSGCNQSVGLLLVGTHPSVDLGIPGLAQSFVIKMESPNFSPTIITGPEKILSIGCGSGVEEYTSILKDMSEDEGWFDLVRMEEGGAGGLGIALGVLIASAIKDQPVPGISQHCHLTLIDRNVIKVHELNRIDFTEDGKEIEVKMPTVATTMPEFEELCRNLDFTIETATACYRLPALHLIDSSSSFVARNLLFRVP